MTSDIRHISGVETSTQVDKIPISTIELKNYIELLIFHATKMPDLENWSSITSLQIYEERKQRILAEISITALIFKILKRR